MPPKTPAMALNLELARVLFRLGSSIAQFRRSIEVNYVGSFDKIEAAYDRSPRVPEAVDEHLAELQKSLDILASKFSRDTSLALNAKRLLQPSERIRRRLEKVWMDRKHEALLREREDLSDKSDGVYVAYLDFDLLRKSPLKPRSWLKYAKAFDVLMQSFPTPCSEWLELAHLLTRIAHPIPSEYDRRVGQLQLMNEEHLRKVTGPRVLKLLNIVSLSFPLITDLPQLSRSAYSYSDAVALHKLLIKRLHHPHSKVGNQESEIAKQTMQGQPTSTAVNQAVTPVPKTTGTDVLGDGTTPSIASDPGPPGDAVDSSVFLIDFTTFSVRWQGMECLLGNRKPFQVLVRLAKRPGFVSVHTLMNEVWGDSTPEKNTVQKTIGTLRKKFDAAGMGDLIIAEPDNYALTVPSGTRVKVFRP